MSKTDFENRIRFLSQYYQPIALDEAMNPREGKRGGRPRVLVTFDDAYSSVALGAAPICERYGVPALFFVNGRFVDNEDLALDNLVCYCVNTRGFGAISDAARDSLGTKNLELRSLAEIFWVLLPTLDFSARESFRQALLAAAPGEPAELAREQGLYVTSAQLRQLSATKFEIGNHSYSHVHGRTLSGEQFFNEIDRNKAFLEAVTGRRVHAYSVPYGASEDLTVPLRESLRRSGHTAAFLASGRANGHCADPLKLDRLSVSATSDAEFFSQLEILPRLRSLRDAVLVKGRGGRPRWAAAKVAQ